MPRARCSNRDNGPARSQPTPTWTSLIDMMAGAVVYRVLQPDPPDVTEMRRYLEEVYRQIGLLPGG